MAKIKVDHVRLNGNLVGLDEEYRGFHTALYGSHWCIWSWDTEILRIPTSEIALISSTEEEE